MKILKVIHGYPMRYNAGSEVYSQTLCQGLADRHEVHVFTREEDPFAPDYRLRREQDPDDARITLHLVNNPRLKDRYRAKGLISASPRYWPRCNQMLCMSGTSIISRHRYSRGGQSRDPDRLHAARLLGHVSARSVHADSAGRS